MLPADLLAALQRQPFKPFWLVTESGTRHVVGHPNLLWVTKASAFVGFPDKKEPSFARNYLELSLKDIVRTETASSLPPTPRGRPATASPVNSPAGSSRRLSET